MTKKIRIDIVIFLVLAAIIISAVSTAYIINKRVSGITSIQSIYTKIANIDEIIEEHYIGSIDTEKLTDEIAKGYVLGISDNYAQYYTKDEYEEYEKMLKGAYDGIGIQTALNELNGDIFVSAVSVGSPAGNAGFKVGDRIISVNDNLVLETPYAQIATLLSPEEGQSINVSVMRSGEEKLLSVTAQKYEQNTVTQKIMGYVGYISISSFNELTPEHFSAAVDSIIEQGAKNLIIDVRNNPGGSIESVVGCVDKIVPTGTVATAVYKRSAEQVGDEVNTKIVYEAVTAQETKIPIVVLCNGNTASGGELFAAALNDFGKATLVGNTTYGKGTGQSFYKLRDGSYVKITDFTYYSPSGAGFNLVGITPEVAVELEENQSEISLLGVDYANDPYLLKGFETLRVDSGILETITR